MTRVCGLQHTPSVPLTSHPQLRGTSSMTLSFGQRTDREGEGPGGTGWPWGSLNLSCRVQPCRACGAEGRGEGWKAGEAERGALGGGSHRAYGGPGNEESVPRASGLGHPDHEGTTRCHPRDPAAPQALLGGPHLFLRDATAEDMEWRSPSPAALHGGGLLLRQLGRGPVLGGAESKAGGACPPRACTGGPRREQREPPGGTYPGGAEPGPKEERGKECSRVWAPHGQRPGWLSREDGSEQQSLRVRAGRGAWGHTRAGPWDLLPGGVGVWRGGQRPRRLRMSKPGGNRHRASLQSISELSPGQCSESLRP